MKVSDIEVSYVDHMGTDLSVVNAARVSFHKESEWDMSECHQVGFAEWEGSEKLKESDAKLIKYLAKHKHTSPFNHSFITLRVKAPIFVARQLVKHKFMPWNEVSRRYVDEEPEFYLPEMRERAENVKQGSGDVIQGRPWIADEFEAHTADCLKTYLWLLEKDVAPEMARMVLPQNVHTEWMWSGTLGAYADMLRLRLDPHAQLESRIVAQKAREIIDPLFPVSLKALLNETSS